MKKLLFFFAILISLTSMAQEKSPMEIFWNNLQAHCGQAYEGNLTKAPENDPLGEKKLIMHMRTCEKEEIKISFFAGEDKSRTWVLRKKGDVLELKHDHRHKDGTEDEVTQYGGTSTNTGLPHLQFFPADAHTAKLLPEAASNVWWITLDEETYTYNLRRLGTDRVFSVSFDLTHTIPTPPAPWGGEE